ncbi:MAG: hypothetical protein JNN13_19760 [Planctomycetes bacterium]|nr:hypothetical protein [Planctomycetota bacterium]
MDTYSFLSDPRAPSLAERRQLGRRHQRDQEHWQHKLHQLCEPPQPDADFPAFLLATAPFADLAHRIAGASSRAELPPATADELDWFVRAFRDYLRHTDDEDVFSSPHHDRG